MTTALLTPQEAADFLGLKVDTLKVWRSRCPDRLPFRRNGRIIRYERAVVEQFFESEKENER